MKILYMCRYAPEEILRAMGAETEYLEPDAADLAPAEAALHAAMCSFTKAAYDTICKRMDGKYPEVQGILFTSCCDSTRRLYDAVKARYPEHFVHMLELPVKQDEEALALYKRATQRMAKAFKAFHAGHGDNFPPGLSPPSKTAAMDGAGEGGDKPRIGLTGAKIPPSLVDAVRRAGGSPVFNLSCSGQEHQFELPDAGEKGLIDACVKGIFSKYPCMRMADAGGARLRGLKKAITETGADGVIYHTVKFCDNYSYEYASLLAEGALGVPLLKLETEYANAADGGALATRLEAFVEQLRGQKLGGSAGMERIVLGIDSGSTSTNAVILAWFEGGQDAGTASPRILATATVPTGPKAAESAAAARKIALKNAGLREKDLTKTVATGYGRTLVGKEGEEITEISCHAAGAHFLHPKARTVIDIGGQDSKIIRLDEDGAVADFAMNDKCAAGTGRFLEMTARSLGVPLGNIGPAALRSREDLSISSMCTVFAESEVVSLVAEDKTTEDILWALCRAVAQRNEALLARAGAQPPYLMTGGVAKNAGVVRAFENMLGQKITVPEDPETVGALGAALL
ncbi:MAG: acyl-CoA dehydratase activase [Clostridiales Family XIII bacterium]|jgi:predicted CoA-substrate-specific enzyme activase|nr:acyl-CoA dehydratase activase [Clostridiales Family XIII bacterium]